jgi:alanine racemase
MWNVDRQSNQFTRPTWIEIDLDAISHNVQQIRQRLAPQVKLMAVVKANAYGYGLLPISLHLANQADYFGVALVEEAIALRSAGIQTPILAFNCYADQYIAAAQQEIEIALSAVEAVAVIEAACRQLAIQAQALKAQVLKAQVLKVQIEMDIGMGLTGIAGADVLSTVERLRQLPNCVVTGLYAQLPLSEYAKPDPQRLAQQISAFQAVADCLPTLPKHLLASPGVALYPDICAEFHYDMVRCGCILLNGESQGGSWGLRDALTLKSQVALIRQSSGQDVLGYSAQNHLHDPTRVAIIPIGYGDGYNREVSSCGEVLIRGKRYPIIGDICMDKLAVAIDDDAVAIGDPVVLLGQQGQEAITLKQIAEATCQNEAITTIGFTERVPRLYQSKLRCFSSY